MELVIDADGHIMETEQELQQFLPDPYNKRRKPYYPQEPWDRLLYGTIKRNTVGTQADYTPHIDDATRLKDLDGLGIDITVLFPTDGLFIGKVRETEWATQLCRAYNDFIGAKIKASPRIKAVALLPPRDAEAARAELNRAVTQMGFSGGMLPAHGHGRNLGDKYYHGVYAEAESLNVPMCIHAYGSEDPGISIFEQYVAEQMCGHALPMMRQCAGIMLGGIPELFPKLRIGFFEAGGVGWVPYWFERMDEAFEKRGHIEAKNLKAKPSAYLKTGRIFFGTEPEERNLPWVAEQVGEGLFMYTSDYPHWDMSADSVKMVKERKDCPESFKRKFLGENAIRFYEFSADVLGAAKKASGVKR